MIELGKEELDTLIYCGFVEVENELGETVCLQRSLTAEETCFPFVKDIIDGSITPDKKYKGVFYRRSTKKYECITPEQMILEGDTLYNVYGDLVLIYGKAGFEGMGIAGLESKDEVDAWMEAKRTKRT